ncbi:calponin homology domain-containing protein [Suillus lakei]|nr:calponin homology domain-containing protein [Suillus lakei]
MSLSMLHCQWQSQARKLGPRLERSNASVSHTINEGGRTEFTNHIQTAIQNNPDIGNLFPIPTPTIQLFNECKDGLILCKLINVSVLDTIDIRMTENNNIVITSAKGIECSVEVDSSGVAEEREHLILGLIWPIIWSGFLAHFNNLKAARWNRRVNNFGRDIPDGENYTILLNQLKPDQCSFAPLHTKDVRQPIQQVLQNVEAIGCRNLSTNKKPRIVVLWKTLKECRGLELYDCTSEVQIRSEGRTGFRATGAHPISGATSANQIAWYVTTLCPHDLWGYAKVEFTCCDQSKF